MLKTRVCDTVQEFTKFHRKQKVSELHSLQRLLREINQHLYAGKPMLFDQQKL